MGAGHCHARQGLRCECNVVLGVQALPTFRRSVVYGMDYRISPPFRKDYAVAHDRSKIDYCNFGVAGDAHLKNDCC